MPLVEATCVNICADTIVVTITTSCSPWKLLAGAGSDVVLLHCQTYFALIPLPKC